MAAPTRNPGRREFRRALRIARSWILRRGSALAARPGRAAPLLLVLLTVIAAAVTGIRGLALLNEQRARRDALFTDVQRLEREAAGLRDEIARLSSDPAALELLAKTRHELVEPGEVVVLLRFPERRGPLPPAGSRYSIR